MKQITMDKKYTYCNGEPARILCVDRPNQASYPVSSMMQNGTIIQHNIYGKYSNAIDGKFDLVEVWEPKDKEPIWEWVSDNIFIRGLCFYDGKNNCLFTKYGKRNGPSYICISKVEHIEQWMIDAQEKLEE